MKVEQRGAVTVVRFEGLSAGWEKWLLLSADRHWDSPDSDLALQKKHLELARERGALVLDIGDLFDAMGGKTDPRSHKAGVRPEHQRDDYLDALVQTAADFFGPYADMFLQMSPGNHELAVRKHYESDLLSRLVAVLNDRTGSAILVGRYAGWVKFRFVAGLRKSSSLNLYYHHGAGGGGPVTKGVIQTNRRAVYLPDADIVASGHIHEAWQVPITRERLNSHGATYLDTQTHVSVPSYKEEYLAHDGFHAERGRPPKPTGCAWVRFFYTGDRICYEVRLDV